MSAVFVRSEPLAWAQLVDREGRLTDEVCPEWCLGAYADGWCGPFGGAVLLGSVWREASRPPESCLLEGRIDPWPKRWRRFVVVRREDDGRLRRLRVAQV